MPVTNRHTTIDKSLYKPKAEGYNLKQAGAANAAPACFIL